MQIDHVFVFPRDLAGLRGRLSSFGLVPSFSRRHPGQGTANLCYCFENTYLELLWIEDRAAVADPRVARTGLMERGSGRTSACPIGLAWRDDAGDAAADLATWSYEAPFLPPAMSIPVALESEDWRVPFVFRSPGAHAPADWTDGRAGRLQRQAGLGAVLKITLDCPPTYRPGPAVMTLTDRTMLRLCGAARWSIELEVASLSSDESVRLPGIC